MSLEHVLTAVAWSDGHLLRPLNRPARRLLGSEDRRLDKLLGPVQLAAWTRLVQRCRSSGASVGLTLETQLTPGSTTLLYLGVVADDEGSLTVTLLDRTRQHEAAAQGQRNSQFLKALLNQTPTIFFVVDRSGHIVFRNDAFDQLAGASVQILSPATMPQLTADFHRSLVELFRTETEQQLRIHSTDTIGRRRQLQLQLQPVKDPDGQTHQALVIGFDLTELVGAHEEQRRLQGELEQARRLEALGQMAGTIAHDFNNFLTVMMGSTLLLQELLPDSDPDIVGTLSDLELVTRRARALTQDLVAFSRAQVHAVRSSRLDAVLAALQASLPRLVPPTVTFHLDMPEAVAAAPRIRVPLSESQILQIAVNMVQNSIDATRGTGTIHVKLAVRARRLEMSFTDNGPGVPQAVRDQIFEPFFTTRSDTGGTGLGLSSARALVERVGGTLRLTSLPAQGAHFEVRIPLEELPS